MSHKSLIVIAAIVAVIVIGSVAATVLNQSQSDGSEKVTYYGNGGTSDGKVSIQSSKETALSGSIFSYEGRIFVSWNTDKNGAGASYKEGDPVEKGISLYAQWKKIILFKMTTNTYSSIYHRYVVGDNYEKLADYSGYYDLPDGNPAIEVRPVQGTTATISDKKVFFQGETSALSIGIDPSGICIKAPEQAGANAKFAIDTNYTNTINWSDNPVIYTTITYNGNGGLTAGDKTTYSANNVFILDNMFAKPPTGKVFNGWNVVADGTGSSVAVGSRGVFGVTYYAQWIDA